MAVPVAADPLRLAMPLDCTLGETCFIQKYVDRDPGVGYRDFACGALSNDGHRGTDFALLDEREMDRGVAVFAAADGTVVATRDGMPDILATDPNAPDLTNRACGNAVVINHADGWQTRYCHLKRGSIAVEKGQNVDSGAPLGQVGLSGMTEFPHVHVSVFKDKILVDPFQPNSATECGPPKDSLWIDLIGYTAGGMISAGFSPMIPEFSAVKEGSAGHATLTDTAPAIVIWAHMFGGRAGDVVDFTITGPNGEFLSNSTVLKRTQARLFRATGRKLGDAPWPAGTYVGTAIMTRDGVEIGRETTHLRVTP